MLWQHCLWPGQSMVWPWDFVGSVFSAQQVPWVFACDLQQHSWRHLLAAYRYGPSWLRLQQLWPPAPPQTFACYQEEFCLRGRPVMQRALGELQLPSHASALPPQRLIFLWQPSALPTEHWPLYASSWHARDAQELGASFLSLEPRIIGSFLSVLHWVYVCLFALSHELLFLLGRPLGAIRSSLGAIGPSLGAMGWGLHGFFKAVILVIPFKWRRSEL